MRYLRSRYGWRIVPTYTTRPAREDDDEKISVSADEFFRLAADERFFSVKRLFGNYYGEARDAVVEAVSQSSVDEWCLDLAISEVERYQGLPTTKIIVLPQTQSQLLEQLAESGRAERLSGAVADLERYREYSVAVRDRPDVLVVINGPGAYQSAAEELRRNVLMLSKQTRAG
jgi:guanylate kinase